MGAKYAGSYVNLNTMDSKQDGGDAFKNKYAGNYLPADVKNWSDKVEVRDAFAKRYAGSYIKLNAMDSDGDAFKNKYAGSYLPRDVKNWSNREEVRKDFENKYASEYTNLYAMKSDKNSDGAAPNRRLVEAQAATITASRESADADAAMEMASVPKQWALTASHASLITAVTLIVAGITFLRATRKAHHEPVLEPLLDP